ncbi:MAG: hypothetical protein K2P14_03330 [Anaeroplasmataceae bacterium]|jgi:hypothetical protein|nr:hypothetical protein [Anaeroplasmataceae bacterium]
MEETKREKFTRLAESRMNAALKQISLIGNLANTSNYEYDIQDVDKILKGLRNAVNELEVTFKGDSKSKKFTL